MTSLDTRVPPPAVVLLAGALAWLIARLAPELTLSVPGLPVLGLVMAALGVAVSGAGIFAFRQARTTVSPIKLSAATALVDTGIYRWTRNPMYLGMAMLLLGWVIILGNPAGLLAIAAFMVYIQVFQIQPEERALSALFGDAYLSYCGRVRRWI